MANKEKKPQSLEETLKNVRFTEGQSLWDKREIGISNLEFEHFKKRQWGWIQNLVTLKGAITLGYVMLIVQAASVSKGSLSSTSLILMSLNPINGMLATAGILILTLGPMVFLTQEYRTAHERWPKNFQNIIAVGALPALLFCPIPIAAYTVMISVGYLTFSLLGRRFNAVQRFRAWILFNMPSLATGIILMGLLFTFWGAPSIPKVVPNSGPYKGETVGLVSQGSTVVIVDFKTGIVMSDKSENFGQLTSCNEDFQRNVASLFQPEDLRTPACTK